MTARLYQSLQTKLVTKALPLKCPSFASSLSFDPCVVVQKKRDVTANNVPFEHSMFGAADWPLKALVAFLILSHL